MSANARTALVELFFYAVVCVLTAALIIDSLSLPPPLREPLGSALVPQIVGALIFLLCIPLVFRALSVLKAEQKNMLNSADAGKIEVVKKRYDSATIIFLIGVVFVAAIQTRWIPSEILTPIFLGGCIWTLLGFKRNAAIPVIIAALVFGLGTSLLFIKFFFVDLP